MKEGYEIIYKRPKTLLDKRMHYCPGCFHATIHKLLMEIVEEMGIQDKTVGVCPVGCSVFAYDYMDVDMQEAAHGRAAALATAVKRMLPDRYVFSYQGDGDLAAIGTAETIHACNRGEKFTFIFINNGIYGMTGGQMAPTTMPEQRTTTSPFGRKTDYTGMPVKMCEMLASLATPSYITRQTLISPKYINRSKKAIKQAFTYQLENRCFSLVELISTCPTNWGMTPLEALKWAEEKMLPYYSLGVFKTPDGEEKD